MNFSFIFIIQDLLGFYFYEYLTVICRNAILQDCLYGSMAFEVNWGEISTDCWRLEFNPAVWG